MHGNSNKSSMSSVGLAVWYGLWLVLWFWLLWEAMVPAVVRGVQVRADAAEAVVNWTYGRGVRPVSIILDLEAGAAQGSVTTYGEATEAAIALGAWPAGAYRLTVSATYRIAGWAVTKVTQVEGPIG